MVLNNKRTAVVERHRLVFISAFAVKVVVISAGTYMRKPIVITVSINPSMLNMSPLATCDHFHVIVIF